MESATIIVFVTSALGLVSGCSNWPGVTSDSTPTGGAYQLEDTSGAIGSSCGSSTTCSQTLTCVSQAPRGLCTKDCNSNDDCNGGVCVVYPAWGFLVCLKPCDSDQVCRPGYSCQTTGTDNICAPGSLGLPDAG